MFFCSIQFSIHRPVLPVEASQNVNYSSGGGKGPRRVRTVRTATKSFHVPVVMMLRVFFSSFHFCAINGKPILSEGRLAEMQATDPTPQFSCNSLSGQLRCTYKNSETFCTGGVSVQIQQSIVMCIERECTFSSGEKCAHSPRRQSGPLAAITQQKG